MRLADRRAVRVREAMVKTRTTLEAPHSNSTRRLKSARPTPIREAGLSGAEGAFRTLKRALRLCRSSRPRLERGDRRITASHQSRPRTLTRPPGGLAAKPQQFMHHPHHQAIPGCAPRPAPGAGGVPAGSAVPGPAGAQRGGFARVGGGRCYCCGHGHLPKSPIEIRSYSGLAHTFRPLSRGLRAAGGC